MDSFLHLSTSSIAFPQDNQASLLLMNQDWHCHESSDYYAGNLLTSATLDASSPDSCSESALLPPELHLLDTAHLLSSPDVSSAHPTANFLPPKSTIWGTVHSEYSWAQESLSRSSGSIDDSSRLSTDSLANDTTQLLDTPDTDTLLSSQWTSQTSHRPPPTSISSTPSIPPTYQRRSWQTTDDHPAPLSLVVNVSPQTYNSFSALSTSSALSADGSKFQLDFLSTAVPSVREKSFSPENFEATSVYDTMARQLQLSGIEVTSANDLAHSPLSSTGFPVLDSSGDNLCNGLTVYGHIQQQQKSPTLDYGGKSVSQLPSNSIVSKSLSDHRFVESSKDILDSQPGNCGFEMNIPIRPSHPTDSLLVSNNYFGPVSIKKLDHVESLSMRRWHCNIGTGSKEEDSPNSGAAIAGGNLPVGKISKSSSGRRQEDELHFETSWPQMSSGHASMSVDRKVLAVGDSRKRVLQNGLAQSNSMHKRLCMETQSGQAVVPLTTSLKRSSSWASSLTSTCSKAIDAIAPGALTYSKSGSRPVVGPALNTNLRPRARQGSANDPQSIAARHRRERISERLKVLQDLVPNGSKVDLVTMLEKAINYVKFLQLQVKVLTTDDYWPSNEKGSAPCTALPNFEDMEGALKTLIAQVEQEAQEALHGSKHSSTHTSPSPELSSPST